KIRGYNVMLGEVEATLRDLDAVKEAAVVAREDGRGHRRLVAYIVPALQPSPTTSELRRRLARMLFDYMVPSTFVMLGALPLLPNGKVDRQALPAPNKARPSLESPFVAPGTPIETKLARLWADVLDLDRVGIHDHFLDLGGHSLLATQILARVVNTFCVDLSVQALLEAPTVAEMAVVITENTAKKAGDEELARMLAELETISDEDARQRLADEEAKEDSEK
ncbi:MAG: phosphopantetheine-binding protein, partial [Acidobacteriota bacterium]